MFHCEFRFRTEPLFSWKIYNYDSDFRCEDTPESISSKKSPVEYLWRTDVFGPIGPGVFIENSIV